MSIEYLHSRRTLEVSLYSGVALVVVSTLFLMQDYQAGSFLMQTAMVMAAPAFFYGIGWLIYHYLDAPLAAPGILATGAWLVAVSLVHLYVERWLLPSTIRPYYWSSASILAAAIITWTGHKARIWLLFPLVPLTQLNAMWAIMDVSDLPIQWWTSVSFLLVLVWWETGSQDERWARVYKVSAALLTFALIAFSYLLAASTTDTIVATWVAGAALVTFLGLRHGWANLGPLAIVMLVCASGWGLESKWWPVAWITLSSVTMAFVEQQATRRRARKNLTAIEISVSLAVLLSGVAALLTIVSPLLEISIHPLLVVPVLLMAGSQLVWLGWRWGISLAVHSGLWLLAAAWAKIHALWLNDYHTFGLWLSLMAVMALLAERVFRSLSNNKRKKHASLRQTIIRWPLADLSIGLSVIILIWTLLNIVSAPPLLLAMTVSIVVSAWVAAGILYRLPILLHVALWIAPLPYAILILYLLPPLRTLPMMGLAWQILAVGYILLGHCLPRHRPAVLAPFFIAGYGILGLSLLLTTGNHNLIPVSLGLVALVSWATSIAVVSGHHPAWTYYAGRLIAPERRPFGFDSLHNLFLLLGASLTVVWVRLMFDYADLSFSRQGIMLVLLSSTWIVLGRLLPRIPGFVGWPIYGAGWFMWLLGLLQVFHAPPEALVTIILGLAISVEALHRTREMYWLPVFVLQILFTALQITRLLTLPSQTVMLFVMTALSVTGVVFDRSYGRITDRAGRVVALSAGVLATALWLIHPDPIITLVISVLPLAAMLQYGRWQWLLPLYGVWIVVGLDYGLFGNWQWLLFAGLMQLAVGIILIKLLRPRRHRTFEIAFWHEQDWASPFLWFGALSTAAAVSIAFLESTTLQELIPIVYGLTIASIIGAIMLGVRNAPYISIGSAGVSMSLFIFSAVQDPTPAIRSLLHLSTGAALAAVGIQLLYGGLVARKRPFSFARRLIWWIRPMMETSYLLGGISFLIILTTSTSYPPESGLPGANSLLLTLFGLVVFLRERRIVWLWVSLGLGWFTWFVVLDALALTGIFWHTIPVGVILILLAQVTQRPTDVTLEYLGVTTLIGGSLLGFTNDRITSTAAVVAGVQVASLIAYGFYAGRRIPFVGGLLVIACGVLVLIVWMNFWLLPLLAGLLLLSAVIVLEVRRDVVERALLGLMERWHGWQ